MKSKKHKQPYSLLQNVGWMLSIGWNTRRRGLTFCLLMAIADVLANVSQLYIAPGVLSLVEQHAPLQTLLGTILFFTLALLLTMGARPIWRRSTSSALWRFGKPLSRKSC